MNIHHPARNDQSLHWTMRVVGLILTLGSMFFLVRNISLGVMDDVFFTLGAVLGVLTFLVSWMPHRMPARKEVSEMRLLHRKRTPVLIPAQRHDR